MYQLLPRHLARTVSAFFAPALPAAEPLDHRYLELRPYDLIGPEPLYMTSAVLRDIRATIGAAPAEQGGMFGGRRRRGVVTDFYFDSGASRSMTTYSPDVEAVNRLLRETWNPSSIDLLGFVHSHPAGATRPSGGDRVYAERILDAIPDMDRMYMPIVQTRPDTGLFDLHPHIAIRGHRGVDVVPVPLRRLTDATAAPSLDDPAFDRVADAYDLEALASLRLVVVGAGGAAGFVESMARAGVGEFVLIDPDVVDMPNIATQQVYRRDIGRAKVAALAERIGDINPHARTVGIVTELDELDDDMMRRLVHRPLPNAQRLGPGGTILCAFTDSFWAQARCNRIALQFGVPMVAAQAYELGIGVEVSFHVPGRSAACGRCVLGSRYRAHLGPDEVRRGVSQGTPLWATERLNATKSQIVLAVAHGIIPGEEEHPGRQRYERLLERIATRNLVQVRLAPDAPLPAFERAFAGADQERLVADETLWLPQEPESPETGFEPCGDCGGTGDLLAVAGSIPDTRLPIPVPADTDALMVG